MKYGALHEKPLFVGRGCSRASPGVCRENSLEILRFHISKTGILKAYKLDHPGWNNHAGV